MNKIYYKKYINDGSSNQWLRGKRGGGVWSSEERSSAETRDEENHWQMMDR
jgi:hypothetical protein